MHELFRRLARSPFGRLLRRIPVISWILEVIYARIRDFERYKYIEAADEVGYVLSIPEMGKAEMPRGPPPLVSEIRFIKYVRDHVDRDSTVFDIGAHIGQHSIPYAKYFSEVIVFEPVPANVELLRENVAANDLDVEIAEVAVADTVETKTIFANEGVAERAGLRAHPGRKSIEVPGVTIDSLDVVPDAIKIDVEGAEQLVLEGGRKVLTDHHPDLFIEVHREKLRGFGHTPDSIREFLIGLDYVAQPILESGPERDWMHYYRRE